jgi:maltooligosyltrehalose trehalohydrolase
MVCVQVLGDAHAMTAQGGGWWAADVEGAGHGTDYAFLVDEDLQPYPDPRSLWQPYGVHGASRVMDHARFGWADAGWVPPPLGTGVIYELHIGTFTPEGTFAAAVRNLAALKELGITHVELMPVNVFPGGRGWGYDGVDLFAVYEPYGGADELKKLVEACHAHGLAVLLDVVYNHFGPNGNYTGKFGPYLTNKYETPWGAAVNLDAEGSVEVRRFICDNVLMWLRDYHFDGLRLDAVSAFVDRTKELGESGGRHMLEQMADEVAELSKQLGKPKVLIAESDLNDPRMVTQRPLGNGMDAQWSDDFHHSLFAFMTGERQSYYFGFGELRQVAKSLREVFVFERASTPLLPNGKSVEGLGGTRFLGYIQDHDQVGNRAYGDRVHAIVGDRMARVAAAMVLTAPFLPMIFQGEEFAASTPFLYFADHEDEALMRSVVQGRLREFELYATRGPMPRPDSEETFLHSKLRWEERTVGEHGRMLEWYRSLIALRKSAPALLDDRMDQVRVEFDEAGKWLVMTRGNVRLYFNFADAPVRLPVAGGVRILLASEADVALGEDAIVLPEASFAAVDV